MNSPWGWLLPLVAAFGYAISDILLKFGIAHGAGPLRTAFLTNLLMAVLMQGFLILGVTPIPWHTLFWPCLAGLCYFVGQLATFRAIQTGQISVATSVLGTKVLMVTLLTATVLRQPIPSSWWYAALMATIGIACLSFSKSSLTTLPNTKTASQLPAVAWGLLSAFFFSATDLLIQESRGIMPPQMFLSILFLFQGLLSLSMLAFFRAPLHSIPRHAWPWLVSGIFLISIQGMLLAAALAWFTTAAEANLLYNTRGLWSVLLALLLARQFGLAERSLSFPGILQRFAGATLLLAAIWLVLA